MGLVFWSLAPVKVKSVPRERGSLSCVAKKVTKEGHPVGPSVPLCVTDAQAGEAFPEGTSLCRPETARIVRAALRVFAPSACRASTGFKSKIKSACFPCNPTEIRTPSFLRIPWRSAMRNASFDADADSNDAVAAGAGDQETPTVLRLFR